MPADLAEFVTEGSLRGHLHELRSAIWQDLSEAHRTLLEDLHRLFEAPSGVRGTPPPLRPLSRGAIAGGAAAQSRLPAAQGSGGSPGTRAESALVTAARAKAEARKRIGKSGTQESLTSAALLSRQVTPGDSTRMAPGDSTRMAPGDSTRMAALSRTSSIRSIRAMEDSGRGVRIPARGHGSGQYDLEVVGLDPDAASSVDTCEWEQEYRSFSMGDGPSIVPVRRSSQASQCMTRSSLSKQRSVWHEESANIITERIRLNRMATSDRLHQEPTLAQKAARAGKALKAWGGSVADRAIAQLPDMPRASVKQGPAITEDSVVPIHLPARGSHKNLSISSDVDIVTPMDPSPPEEHAPRSLKMCPVGNSDERMLSIAPNCEEGMERHSERFTKVMTLSTRASKPRSTNADVLQHMKIEKSDLGEDQIVVSKLGAIVMSAYFDGFFAVAIACNAVLIGCATDHMATTNSEVSPRMYTQIDTVFTLLFSVELALRLLAFGRKYFAFSGFAWGGFDILAVGLQLVEEVYRGAARDGEQGEGVSGVSIIRVLRLIRVMRVIRIIRFFGELRTLVVSIMNSMRSLFWTIVLLLLGIYLVAVYFTQLMLDLRLSGDDGRASELNQYFGSLPRSMLTLYSVMSGGIDWDPLCAGLAVQTHPVQALIFTAYITFTILALTNVVTGVFVEGALKSAKLEEEELVLETLTRMFMTCDSENEGQIPTEEFNERLKSDEMTKYLKSIDVDPGEANMLCRLLDNNNSGTIDYEEFVGGCLRIRGTSKAIDTIILLHEVNEVRRDFVSFCTWTEEALLAIAEAIQEREADAGMLGSTLTGGVRRPIREGDDE